MGKDILDLLTDANAERVASDIVKRLSAFKSFTKIKDAKEREKIGRCDIDFELSKGRVRNEDANTWFSFDLNADSSAYEFLKAIYARDVDDEENHKINQFLAKVTTIINTAYVAEMREAIRAAAIPEWPAKLHPLESIEVLAIDLTDYSAIREADRYTLKFAKAPDAITNMRAMLEAIQSVAENDDRPAHEIGLDLLSKGHPAFYGVRDIEQGDKYLWDVSLTIFADYSADEATRPPELSFSE